MAMTAPGAELERAELAPAAALFRSLGDPARLMIVRHLAAGPAGDRPGVRAGVGAVDGVQAPGVLAGLRAVTSEPAGRPSVFRLTQPALAEMLTAAQAVLAATGNAVALCPAWGIDGCDGELRDGRIPALSRPWTPAARKAHAWHREPRLTVVRTGGARPG